MGEQLDISGSRVWVAGHTGLVGSALVKRLRQENVILLTASHGQLDLRHQQNLKDWMNANQPEIIILAAAKVGGIGANAEFPADFMNDNLAIAQNVIHQAAQQKVRKLVFLGSSCIYPKYAEQPIKPEALLTGALEPTNEAYALAKIAGLKLCQFYRQQYGHDFISVMPCNLYGPGDRWLTVGAHVIPSLINRLHLAMLENQANVSIWGSGKPLREFLYSDDLATAIVVALKNYSHELPLNMGSAEEISIADLAKIIARVIGYKGQLSFDTSKPDGTPRKVMDSSVIGSLGWQPQTSLEDGLRQAYADYLEYCKRSDNILVNKS